MSMLLISSVLFGLFIIAVRVPLALAPAETLQFYKERVFGSRVGGRVFGAMMGALGLARRALHRSRQDHAARRAGRGSRLGEPTPERGGRAKRYFRVTPDGVREARSTREALSVLWEGLPQLEGGRA